MLAIASIMGAVASISNRVGDLGEYLREQRENAKLSLRQLASLAGVSNPYLSQVERGLRRPSAEVLQQIAKGLRISAEALYVRAGILDEDLSPGVEVAVHADSGLTDRQKRVLLDIYTAFRAENVVAEKEAADNDKATDDEVVGGESDDVDGDAAVLPPQAEDDLIRAEGPESGRRQPSEAAHGSRGSSGRSTRGRGARGVASSGTRNSMSGTSRSRKGSGASPRSRKGSGTGTDAQATHPVSDTGQSMPTERQWSSRRTEHQEPSPGPDQAPEVGPTS